MKRMACGICPPESWNPQDDSKLGARLPAPPTLAPARRYDRPSGLKEEFMRRNTSLLAVALLALVAAAGWMHGQPEAAATLTAEDRAEITQLYATMYQGSDFRDADLWLSAFAKDAVFVFPTGDQLEGHDALMAWRQRSFGGQTGDSKRRRPTGARPRAPTGSSSMSRPRRRASRTRGRRTTSS